MRRRTEKGANQASAAASGGRAVEKAMESEPAFVGVLRHLFNALMRIVKALAVFSVVLLFVVYMIYGGRVVPFPYGERVADIAQLESTASLEMVAALPFPPGNIAVASNGRVFVTLHPEGAPSYRVVEVVEMQMRPYPDEVSQTTYFNTPLSIRIATVQTEKGTSELLWVLDFAQYAVVHTPRLLAFDLASGALVHDYYFPSSIAGAGSMLNDFQIDTVRGKIYIADASMFRLSPAIIVYDIETRTASRHLHNHPSVKESPYVIRIKDLDKDMIVLGVFQVRPGVDSIALDRKFEYLYYSAVNSDVLYRIHTKYLLSGESDEALSEHVEVYCNKTMSDGMTTDSAGNIWYGDMEHSALMKITPERKLHTVMRDIRLLRWIDGFSYGPENYLYFTCSCLQHVIFKSKSTISAAAPFHVWRVRTTSGATPGQ